MEKSGFFNATKEIRPGVYDKMYLAEDFANYFASFVGNGVYAGKSSELQVYAMPEPAMRVRISGGQGFINGYWYSNDTSDIEKTLNIDFADGYFDRIDNIVLTLDYADGSIYTQVVKGTATSLPTAPRLIRNSDYYQLKLAEVTVKANAYRITQSEIKDTRLDPAVCGIVTGKIQEIDISTAYEQFEAQFNDWFDTIKGQLSGDVAGNLQNQINNLGYTVNTFDSSIQGNTNKINTLNNTTIPDINNRIGTVESSMNTITSRLDESKIKSINFANWKSGSFSFVDGNGSTKKASVVFDSKQRPTSITVGGRKMNITW